MINVTRSWQLGPENSLNYLFKRPRVDYRISEYVVNYIHKTIPQFDKILSKNYHNITLDFSFAGKGIRDEDAIDRLGLFGYFTDRDYLTCDTSYVIFGKKSTLLQIMCTSTRLRDNITPREYADIVHTMVSVLIKRWYKRVTKEIMDDNRRGMDYDLINSFEFPAVYENQKYDDSGEFRFNGNMWWNEEMIKKECKKHYKELG